MQLTEIVVSHFVRINYSIPSLACGLHLPTRPHFAFVNFPYFSIFIYASNYFLSQFVQQSLNISILKRSISFPHMQNIAKYAFERSCNAATGGQSLSWYLPANQTCLSRYLLTNNRRAQLADLTEYCLGDCRVVSRDGCDNWNFESLVSVENDRSVLFQEKIKYSRSVLGFLPSSALFDIIY